MNKSRLQQLAGIKTLSESMNDMDTDNMDDMENPFDDVETQPYPNDSKPEVGGEQKRLELREIYDGFSMQDKSQMVDDLISNLTDEAVESLINELGNIISNG